MPREFDFLLTRYDPLPETREGIPRNHFPVSQRDIRHLAQVYGETIAENIRLTAQEAKRMGGINPNARDLILPDGLDGPLDENELFRIAGNLAIWWETSEPS